MNRKENDIRLFAEWFASESFIEVIKFRVLVEPLKKKYSDFPRLSKRNKYIIIQRLADSGLCRKEIAHETGLSYGQVCNAIKKKNNRNS